MKQNVIVLSAKRYSMTDEKTGRLVEGVTVWYLTTDHLASVIVDQDNVGCQPCKVSLPIQLWDKVRIAPGIYDCEFALRPASGGKLNLVPVDLNYMSDIYGVKDDVKK